ncbi:MAG: hypothetical protein OXM03_08600 [Chloroflexota bacterium]|nr:hypothetical protein [Chloroflexota bacterium]MDE2840673.1 hypothetical protein [Chloroflexota bacterium]
MSERKLDPDSSAVQTHLQIMQDVIRRMAENSRSCKVWCVTLVSATLVLVAQTGNAQNALIALVPTVLFLVLDTYYLALERAFRNSYETFVSKLHKGDLASSDIYLVKPTGMGWKLAWRCLWSVSILPFYLLLVVTIVLSWLVIVPSNTLVT